jgi:hypothetical protein
MIEGARPGRDVSDAPADRARVRGYVEHVAPTDAFALMWDGSGVAHIPLAVVAAVRKPHHTMSDLPVVPRVQRRAIVLPGQLEMDFPV